MRVVILEDYPDRLVDTVSQLRNFCPEGCDVEILIYDPQNEYGEKKGKLKQKLGCVVNTVDYWDFDEKLDEMYNDQETLFLFDTDIDRGATIEVFEYRINVKYALKKKGDGRQSYRIWFYTTVEHLKRAIERTFEEHVIEAGQKGSFLNLDVEGCASFREALGL